MMLCLDTERIFKQRGIRDGRVWLVNHGMTYSVARKLTDGTLKRIDVRTVELLCELLDCELCDLFSYSPDEGHVIGSLSPLIRDPKTLSIYEFFEDKSLAEVEAMLRKLMGTVQHEG